MPVYLNAVGVAAPDQDVHAAFIDWARGRVPAARRRLFDRMVTRSAIDHRWSVLPATAFVAAADDDSGFYAGEQWPGTGARMQVYAAAAPVLALAAIEALTRHQPLGAVTHLIVASCTGFVAPGIDQIIAAELGLSPSVERLLVGFMGCYAAVSALRSARHIVRSDPDARVLVVTVELSTLHLQATDEIESLVAMLQFGDGAAAAIVSADATGLRIDTPFATTLPDSAPLIRWAITDSGFVMHLSGEVPTRIAAALADPAVIAAITDGRPPDSVDAWAVHAGGRSILDAVEQALALPPDALAASRAVLRDYGNMSSSTLMFVLAAVLAGPRVERGVALAFGPGLAAEGFRFAAAP